MSALDDIQALAALGTLCFSISCGMGRSKMTELERQDNRKPKFLGMYFSVAVFLLCGIFRNGTPRLDSPLTLFLILGAAASFYRIVLWCRQWVQERRIG